MNDASRLHLAADVLDEVPCRKDEIGGACPCMVYFRAARLLRAVADGHALQPGEPDDGPCQCPEFLAALALADEILGDAVPLDDDYPPVGDVDPAQVAASLRDIAASRSAGGAT